MTRAVANGETDLVGLARASALIPDLPHRAAIGQFDAIDLIRLSTGIRALDRRVGSYIGLSYYEMQMARLAQGKAVRVTRNAWIPLGYALRTQGPSFLTPRRA